MNEQERQIISDIFRRLETAANQPRDPEAERFIAEMLRRQPYAPYAMAQAIFVQEQAVTNLNEQVQQLADEKRVTAAQLALAWVLSRGVVPIPGTKRVGYLEENVAASAVELDESDLRRLEEAAPVGSAVGDRYSDMSSVGR